MDMYAHSRSLRCFCSSAAIITSIGEKQNTVSCAGQRSCYLSCQKLCISIVQQLRSRL